MHLLKTRGDFTAAARDAKPEPNQVRLPATAFSRRPRASRPSLCAPGARAPPPAQASLPVRPASRITPCVGDIGLSSVRRVGVGSTGASATAPACGQRCRAARIEQSVQRDTGPRKGPPAPTNFLRRRPRRADDRQRAQLPSRCHVRTFSPPDRDFYPWPPSSCRFLSAAPEACRGGDRADLPDASSSWGDVHGALTLPRETSVKKSIPLQKEKKRPPRHSWLPLLKPQRQRRK